MGGVSSVRRKYHVCDDVNIRQGRTEPPVVGSRVYWYQEYILCGRTELTEASDDGIDNMSN